MRVGMHAGHRQCTSATLRCTVATLGGDRASHDMLASQSRLRGRTILLPALPARHTLSRALRRRTRDGPHDRPFTKSHQGTAVRMNARQLRGANSIDNSLANLANIKHKSPAVARIEEELQIARDELMAQYTSQVSSRQGLGAHGISLKLARRNLRQKHLLPIVTRGKVLLKGLPGIREELRLPRVRATDAEWIAAARRVAKVVRPHRKVFLEAHFAPDFLRQLDVAAKQLQVATRSENARRVELSRSTRGVAETLRHCRDLVAAADALLMASGDVDETALKMWRKAKRIPKRVGRPPRKKARRERREA